MELHLVHFNTKYGEDIKEAIGGGKGKQDTLAVLGIMFRISGDEDNQDMEPIIKSERNYLFIVFWCKILPFSTSP